MVPHGTPPHPRPLRAYPGDSDGGGDNADAMLIPIGTNYETRKPFSIDSTKHTNVEGMGPAWARARCLLVLFCRARKEWRRRMLLLILTATLPTNWRRLYPAAGFGISSGLTRWQTGFRRSIRFIIVTPRSSNSGTVSLFRSEIPRRRRVGRRESARVSMERDLTAVCE